MLLHIKGLSELNVGDTIEVAFSKEHWERSAKRRDWWYQYGRLGRVIGNIVSMTFCPVANSLNTRFGGAWLTGYGETLGLFLTKRPVILRFYSAVPRQFDNNQRFPGERLIEYVRR